MRGGCHAPFVVVVGIAPNCTAAAGRRKAILARASGNRQAFVTMLQVSVPILQTLAHAEPCAEFSVELLMSAHLLLPIMLCLSVLAGCASLQHPIAVDWENGARRGRVTRSFDASTPADQLPQCLQALPSTELTAHRYVEVEAKHRRHLYRDAGALPDGMRATVGDMVEFYPKNCDAGSLSRITRLLPPAPPP